MKHIDYVIGMRDSVFDKAAIAFSIGFYDSLGYGRNIEEAFSLGKNAILWEYANYSGTTRQGISVGLAQTDSSVSLPEHLKPILLKKADNVVQKPINQPQSVNLPNTDTPLQKYRQRIQEYLKERPLTPIVKFQLATLAKKLSIFESEANNILEAELEKIADNKAKYQEIL